jgi:hypothetical protein
MMPMRSLHEVLIAEEAMGATKGLVGCIIILIILGLAGCAPTGYKKASSSPFLTDYGYKDKRINGDEFSIVVLGNKFTSKARAAEIALLRAARLTKEEGKTHFVIIKQKAQTTERAVPISFPLLVGGVLVPVPVGEKTDKEPMVILLIRPLPPQPAYPPDALNAAEVIEQLAKHLK